MTHQDIDQQEIVEDYVRNKLAQDRRQAFEEHFFACDECFDRVQSAERFVAGVQYAAEAGLLTPVRYGTAAPATRFWAAWLKPALAVSAAVSVSLAAVLAWLLFYRTPQLQGELARERDQQERLRLEDQQKLDRAAEDLNGELARRSELERELSELKETGRPSLTAQPEANVPLVMLEAERSRQAPINVQIPAGARSLVLLSEPGPDARFASYRVEIDSPVQRHVLTAEGLKKNADGMLTCSLPASALGNGIYIVRVYGMNRGRAELAAEYRISVRKK